MAFSTQKGFQHVPFLNEYPQPLCLPMEGIKLKTYGSARDERAWCMSDKKQAQYLIDLVSCRLYDDDALGDGLLGNSSPPCKKKSIGQVFPKRDDINDNRNLLNSINAEKDYLKSRLNESQENLKTLREENKALNDALSGEHQPDLFIDMKKKISQLRKSSKIDKNDENELLKMLDGLKRAEKAYNAINIQNRFLRNSVEKLSLRNDLTNIPVEPETNTNVDYLQNEVNNLRKELAQLRTFEEKTLLKETVNLDQQQVEQVDSDEHLDHIKAERNALREKCESFASVESKIIEWKNDAEQFKSFRKKACMALKQKDEEIQDCRERIQEVEYEFKEIVKCFKSKEQEREAICSAYDCLKDENQRLKEEVCRCNCDLKAITTLQNQIQFLSNELCEKNCAIEQYDMQFQQLLGVIEELQTKAAVDIRNLQDVDSQTQSENIEELAVSTRATLDQISKELENRQELESDLAASMAELETIRRETEEKDRETVVLLNAKEIENQKLKESLQKTNTAVKESLAKLNLEVNPDEDCLNEVARLNELVTKLKSEHENEIELLKKKSTDLLRDLETERIKDSGVEKLISDQVNSLKAELTSAQEKNRQLQNQNEDLNKDLEECQNKVKAQQDEIKKLDKKTTELLCASEASLKEVGKLVNDISNVQDRNENLKSVLGVVDYSEKSKQEIEDLKKLLDEEMKKSKNCEENSKLSQKELDEAKEMLALQKTEMNNMKKLISDQAKEVPSPQKTVKSSNEQKNVLQSDLGEDKKRLSSPKPVKKVLQSNAGEDKKRLSSPKPSVKATSDQTFRAVDKVSDEQDTAESKGKSAVSGASDALVQPGSSSGVKKSSIKLTQLQKLHEATRNAERIHYEKEIEGHRLSNELLKSSLTKLTSKVQNDSAAAEFEKEMRLVLDNFALEICKWRCEKNFKKLTKLQEISKRILEYGINCLAYKDLVYLHQKMSEAALRLEPDCLSSTTSSSHRELLCCKCSQKICQVPINPKENKLLLQRMLFLEREIQNAREELRKSKEQKEMWVSDVDQSDSDTLRAIPKQIGLAARKVCSKPRSPRISYIKEEEFQIPTKDRF